MSERPTPETDAFAVKFKSVCGSKTWVPTDICRRFERERDKAAEDATNYYARLGEVERERDEAREALAATKHYLTKERDDALAQIVQAECRAERFCQERDEARAQLEIIKPNQNNPVAEFFSSSNTPETDAAIIASEGQWSFVLKETCQKLERERNELREEVDRYREKLDLLPISWEV